jgi:hypothetical protein
MANRARKDPTWHCRLEWIQRDSATFLVLSYTDMACSYVYEHAWVTLGPPHLDVLRSVSTSPVPAFGLGADTHRMKELETLNHVCCLDGMWNITDKGRFVLWQARGISESAQ